MTWYKRQARQSLAAARRARLAGSAERAMVRPYWSIERQYWHHMRLAAGWRRCAAA